MNHEEPFVTNRRRYRPVTLPRLFSDEEMARDWTLSENDKEEVGKYRKDYRLFRLATCSEQRTNILDYLGYRKFDDEVQAQLQAWLELQAGENETPDQLFQRAEGYLLSERIILPGTSVLERLIISHCAATHEKLFTSLHQRLSPGLRQAIDRLLAVPEDEQRSYFYQLKEYPPSASVSSLQDYLNRYRTLVDCGVDGFEIPSVAPAFLTYLFQLARRYSAKDIKRFRDHKRYALMVCFLLETRKVGFFAHSLESAE